MPSTSFTGADISRTNGLRILLLLCLQGTWWLSWIPQTWETTLFKTEFTQPLSWSVWMMCINARIWAPQDPFASPSTRKQSSWQKNVFLCICHDHILNVTLEPAKDEGTCSILNGGMWLFFQLTFSGQNPSGMAGQRALLTSNPYSHSIPWQALSQQRGKISQYLIHCLVSSASPKNLVLKGSSRAEVFGFQEGFILRMTIKVYHPHC